MKRAKQGIGTNTISRSENVTTMIVAFATRIREWRIQNGRLLKEVAGEIGVSTSIVCEWEHAHRFPSLEHLEALSTFMGIPTCCLLYSGKDPCPGRRCGRGRQR